TLGLRMLAGRDFTNGEDAPGNLSIAIVTDRFARATGMDRPGVARLLVNGTPRLVVGILPSASEVALLQEADVFTPLVVEQRASHRHQSSCCRRSPARHHGGQPRTADVEPLRRADSGAYHAQRTWRDARQAA